MSVIIANTGNPAKKSYCTLHLLKETNFVDIFWTKIKNKSYLPDCGVCRNTLPEGGVEDEGINGLDHGLQEAVGPLIVVATLLQPGQHSCNTNNNKENF